MSLPAANLSVQTPSPDAAAAYLRQRLADGAACLAAALDYLSLGLSALALCPPDHVGIDRVSKTHRQRCKSPGKVPWPLWAEFEDRLPTGAELRDFWRQMPTSNVGAALGPVSGVVRLDVEGGAAHEQLREVSGGDLPKTWTFRSGRADGTGLGLLYAIPPGVSFMTTPTRFQHGELRFQARGAQTVLPPSRHKDGGLYEWLPGLGPRDLPPAPGPGWVAERYRDRPGRPRRGRRAASGGGAQGHRPVSPGALFKAVVALHHLSAGRAGNYDDWLHVGMALHSVSPGLLDEWDEWSRRCPEKYEEGACDRRWASFGRREGYRLGHLLEWARQDNKEVGRVGA
jgi:hypothetical protein